MAGRAGGRRSRPGTIAAVLLLAVVATLWSGTGSTFGAWPTAVISNAPLAGSGGSSTAVGSLAFSHAYQSTTCSAGPRVTSTTTCPDAITPTTPVTSGGVSATDTITNIGTLPAGRLTQQMRVESCAPVQLANEQSGANPLLPRYATRFQAADPFGGTNAVTLGGGDTYAAAVAPSALTLPLVGLGVANGYGVWFKAAPGSAGGPLFGFSASASDGAGAADRSLSLSSTGKLVYVANTSSTRATQTTATDFRDNTWHFAYVSTRTSNLLTLGLGLDVTVSVDGATLVSVTGVSGGPSSYQGYWHLGWSPLGSTGVSTDRFTGSLSSFVVFGAGGAPVAAKPTDQAAMDAFAAGSTEYWKLGDSGTTTFTGALPGSVVPCAQISSSFSFSNPTGPGALSADKTLAARVTDGWQDVAAAAPGGSQVLTTTLRRASTYDTTGFVQGLRLYVPLAHRVMVEGWILTFRWSGPAATVIA